MRSRMASNQLIHLYILFSKVQNLFEYRLKWERPHHCSMPRGWPLLPAVAEPVGLDYEFGKVTLPIQRDLRYYNPFTLTWQINFTDTSPTFTRNISNSTISTNLFYVMQVKEGGRKVCLRITLLCLLSRPDRRGFTARLTWTESNLVNSSDYNIEDASPFYQLFFYYIINHTFPPYYSSLNKCLWFRFFLYF